MDSRFAVEIRRFRSLGTFRSKNCSLGYLQGTGIMGSTESLTAVRRGFIGVPETANLTQVHSLLQIADR